MAAFLCLLLLLGMSPLLPSDPKSGSDLPAPSLRDPILYPGSEDDDGTAEAPRPLSADTQTRAPAGEHSEGASSDEHPTVDPAEAGETYVEDEVFFFLPPGDEARLPALLESCAADYSRTSLGDRELIRVSLLPQVDVNEALRHLEAQGVSASPNYIYYPVEDPSFEASEEALSRESLSDDELAGDGEYAEEAPLWEAASPEKEKNKSEEEGDEPLPLQEERLPGEDALPVEGDSPSEDRPSEGNETKLLAELWGLLGGRDPDKDFFPLRDAWALLPAGRPHVKLGVVDTGVDSSHFDLQDALFENGVSDSATAHDHATVEEHIQDSDDKGHGTHISGILGATAGNPSEEGPTGMAGMTSGYNEARLRGDGSTEPVVEVAMVDAYTLYTSPSTGKSYMAFLETNMLVAVNYLADKGCRIINLSLGVQNTTGKRPYNALFALAEERDILLVCASGNDNSPLPFYPAHDVAALSVGSTAQTGGVAPSEATRWCKSNYNNALDLAAPGVNIYSTAPGNSYRSANGTSMAAPFVAGLAAMMLYIDPSLSVREMKNILYATAANENYQGLEGNQLGFGLIRPREALQAVLDRQAAPKPAERIECNLSHLSLAPGEWDAIEYRLFPADCGDCSLVWESSDPSVATVDESGRIRAQADGHCSVIARHGDGLSVSISVDVKTPGTPFEDSEEPSGGDDEPLLSNLRLLKYNLPSGLYQGRRFDIRGSIDSALPLRRVEAGIVDAKSGKWVRGHYVNKTGLKGNRFDLATLSTALSFRSLPTGTYYYRVWAHDSLGTTRRLVNQRFAVKPAPKASLKKYNYPRKLKKGKDFKIKGKLSCNTKITRVEILIVKRSNGKWVQKYDNKKVNAKSFNLNKANKKLRFHKLAKGKYYYRVRVHGKDLQTTRLLNKAFTVK